MIFTVKELAAIHNLAKVMVDADGKIEGKEAVLAALELTKLSNGIDSDSIVKMAETMEPAKAFEVVKNMTTDEKKYVSGFLAAISVVDGNVAPQELAMWKAISALGNFPAISFEEALRFWDTH